MKKKNTNGKPRRKDVKYPGLDPRYNSKAKQEYLDFDYVDQLTEAQKEWLNQFSEEFYGAALDVDNLENNLHNTPQLKQDCQRRNNARNRCVYSQHKAMGRLLPWTSYTETSNEEEDED